MHSSDWFGIGRAHWIAGLALFAAVAGWMGYQYQIPVQKEQQAALAQRTGERVAHDESCDLRAGPCNTVLPDGASVSFGIEPREIPVAETLDLEVRLSGMDVEEITVDINGVNMRMPPNRVTLHKTEQGVYKGQAGLMFCSVNIMEWETVLELNAGSRKLDVPFRFITTTPNQNLVGQ